jgi:hypothetical protein
MSFHDDIMEKVDRIAHYAGQPRLFDEDFFGAAYAAENIGLWRSRFSQFTKADPASAGELVTNLNTAATDLTVNNEGTLDAIDTEIHEWTGRAAEGFRGYVGQVKDAVGLQCDAVKALSKIAEAHQKMLEGMRQDVRCLADNTIEALQTSGGGDGGWSFGFAVLAAAAYVLSAATAGGAAVVWAAVAGFSSVASTATTTATIAGQSQVEKLQSMEQALEDLRDAVIQEQQRLQAALRAVTDFFAQYQIDIRPSRPMIATPMSNTPSEKSWTIEDFSPTPGT